MALQGTLETFSVPEVLRLLSGTRKTGHLALGGDRGEGNVWLADGRIVRAVSDHEQGDKVQAVLFDLLRFESGSFSFDSDARVDEPTEHDLDVEEVLGEAERMLEEWREIESVVPSLDVHVHMVDELSGDSVIVTADQWRSLALVGSGISARRLGAHLDLGEFDACSLVRDLVEAGLVEVAEERLSAPGPEPVVDHDLSNDEVASLGENLAGFVARPDDTSTEDTDTVEADTIETDTVETDTRDTGAGDTDTDDVDDIDLIDVADDVAFEPEPEPELEPVFEDEPAFESDPEPESDDFLSQLSNFSPKAAAAIEATADDASDAVDEADQSPDGVAEGDEEVNRNLLLKFLSSAKN